MTKEILHNKLLVPPCLLVNSAEIKYQFIGSKKFLISEKYWPDTKQEKQDGNHHYYGRPPSKNGKIESNRLTKPLAELEKETKRIISESIENYLLQMVSQCALKISLPIQKSLPSPTTIKRGLTPTIRKTISFLDNQRGLWDAIVQYLKPIRDSVKIDDKFHPYEPSSVYLLSWNLYMLVLGIRSQSQIVMSPESTLELIKMFLTKPKKISREAKARLMLLNGIFSSFEMSEGIGGFQIRPEISLNMISERLEEIVEDAYLLEASSLRKFLSFNANKTAIKRDLRKLVNFISKNRPWAKGLLRSTEHLGFIGSTNAVSGLIDALPGNFERKFQPICISPITHLSSILGYEKSKRLMVLRNE